MLVRNVLATVPPPVTYRSLPAAPQGRNASVPSTSSAAPHSLDGHSQTQHHRHAYFRRFVCTRPQRHEEPLTAERGPTTTGLCYRRIKLCVRIRMGAVFVSSLDVSVASSYSAHLVTMQQSCARCQRKRYIHAAALPVRRWSYVNLNQLRQR